jgi:GNAT superfamily N-acetyltransferase
LKTTVRLAEAGDADAITALLIDLGYRVPPGHVSRTLTMPSQLDPVFVAIANGIVVGMLSLHVARWIQLDKPIARIPAMIVSVTFQRRGIGRQLVRHALDHAKRLGCGAIELTSGSERTDAHAFYRDMGFEQTSVRFKRSLD